MRTVFPEIETFGVKGPWGTEASRAENLLFFLGPALPRMREPGFEARVARLAEQGRVPYQALPLLHTRVEEGWSGGLVLTDDYAPYDLLIGREAAAGPFGGSGNSSAGAAPN